MMTRGHFHLGIALALAGCVQPGQQRPSASDLPPVPHIEPVMEGLIDEKPIWESQPVTANAVTVDQQLYIVKIGDTLRAVGETTRVGSEAIARANMLTAPFSIKAGQVLRITGIPCAEALPPLLANLAILVHHRKIQTIAMGNRGPVVNSSPAERIHAHVNVRIADCVHIDHATEIVYISI